VFVQRRFESLQRRVRYFRYVCAEYFAYSFSSVPCLDIAEKRVGTSREFQPILEAEEAVDFVEELEEIIDLAFNLIWGADYSIMLILSN
jgi:hypothetical protein